MLDRLRSFDVRPLLANPYAEPKEASDLGAELVDTDELCRRSDLLSIHAPALPETRHLLDDRRLSLLRDGATVINTARGSLVDTRALTRHCAAGRLSAVLDVTDPEPLPPAHPLLSLPNVLVTPHLAGAQGMSCAGSASTWCRSSPGSHGENLCAGRCGPPSWTASHRASYEAAVSRFR